jgi:DNA-binding NtrC family response regulator
METRQKWPVVLVDDEEDILFGAEYLLNTHGITTVTSLSDGRELIPLLERQTAGVIVLDLFMPQMSGLELLPRLAREYPEIPVVVMTASQEVETAVSCMKEGAFDYLVKPVEESRFVSSVRRGPGNPPAAPGDRLPQIAPHGPGNRPSGDLCPHHQPQSPDAAAVSLRRGDRGFRASRS